MRDKNALNNSTLTRNVDLEYRRPNELNSSENVSKSQV